MTSEKYAQNWLTKSQWNKLRKAPDKKDYSRGDIEMKSWRDELLLKTTYRGALRINETLSLKFPYDYETEEDRGFVIVRTSKTKDKAEQQAVGEDIVRDTKRFISAFHEEDTNYIFTDGRGNTITRQRAYQIMNELGDIVDINKKLGTHTLRRSRAKHLLDSGKMDLSEVSRFLRHKKLATTMDYLNFAKKSLAKKAKKIDKELNL